MTSPKDNLPNFEKKIRVRRLRTTDFDGIIEMQKLCFPEMSPWTREQFESQLRTFPEGQICVDLGGVPIASSSSLIVDFDLNSEWHDWKVISDDGFIKNHDPTGDSLYGIEIMVHPKYQGLRLTKRLYDARKELCHTQNLARMILGGRIPGYKKYAKRMSARQYADRVQRKALHDPVLSAQLANGFTLLRLIPDYLPSDEDSAGWATHMEWLNLAYESNEQRRLSLVQSVRVGAVQYQLRRVDSFEDFAQQVEFFADTASDYHCDFLLFPELFTLQLLSITKAKRPGLAARQLAEFTPQYLELMTRLAVKYSVNIIGGSNFSLERRKLLNISYLFRRNGTIARQPKLHITPAERRWWGVEGGDKAEVFETDRGRIAINICYDIEFPEVARVAAKKGAQIIFVPFNTDTRPAYVRVRSCAQARCIENHLYAVLAGCTGNLPNVENADIHYAQSAVLTPVDVPFARDGVAAECDPNIETLVVQDLDLEQLRRHRYSGATQNWNDRRRDLFSVRYTEKENEDVSV
jgi:predicted amidohydrolase/ribosomal protein S18 acetylase RimI-like enzyme